MENPFFQQFSQHEDGLLKKYEEHPLFTGITNLSDKQFLHVLTQYRVPKNMFGSILYPLNMLKETHPEVYAEHAKKYEGREQLLTATVPPLNCLWNDVLHFTAVAPHELKANLAKAGITVPPTAWYKVPVTLIEGQNSIAFIYRRDLGLMPNFKEYEPFDVSKMYIYRKVPDETIEYYKEENAKGKRPLLFHLVPHILFRGTINTTGLEVVTE